MVIVLCLYLEFLVDLYLHDLFTHMCMAEDTIEWPMESYNEEWAKGNASWTKTNLIT